MKDRTDVRSDELDGIAVPADVDRSRCVLCGGPNGCVMASAPSSRDRDPTGQEPCWCVGRRFPADLTASATARDGGAACICEACLDAGASRARQGEGEDA